MTAPPVPDVPTENMPSLKNIQVGHFLTYALWTSAKDLLDYQITSKASCRTYDNLAFNYLEKVQPLTKRLAQKTYYKTRISNNLFYGLEKEFFFHSFTVPKEGIGLRNYKFFSYPMHQLYYAVGLYLLRTTQQFLVDKKSPKIHSFYGGDLKFATGSLVLNNRTTLYYDQYKRFKDTVVNETSSPDDRIVVFVDIQDFYDSIRISRLVDLIKQHAKPSDLTFYNFDSSTKEQIEFFFRFLGNGTDNLPTSDSNLISGFVGHLYSTFGDLILDDIVKELNREFNIIADHKIIRYVDDTYISLTFQPFDAARPKYTEETRSRFMYQLLNFTADQFFRALNLKCNRKAETFRLYKASELRDIQNKIKKVSEDYPIPGAAIGFTGPQRVARLIAEVRAIKTKDVADVYKGLSTEESETLKDVFDRPVRNLISWPANLAKLEAAFQDVNFDLLRLSPLPLIILIAMCPLAMTELRNYFLTKKSLTTFDTGLLVLFLCQTGLSDKPLSKLLDSDLGLAPILAFMKRKAVVDDADTGYFDVNFKTFKPLPAQVSLIEQIRQRVYSERLGHVSTALNHLLNEVQLACCTLESKDIKTYQEPDVRIFLTVKGLDNSTITKISNLFNRRNNNPVSHPGSDTRVAWAVEIPEYYEYKKYVAKTMKAILT